MTTSDAKESTWKFKNLEK